MSFEAKVAYLPPQIHSSSCVENVHVDHYSARTTASRTTRSRTSPSRCSSSLPRRGSASSCAPAEAGGARKTRPRRRGMNAHRGRASRGDGVGSFKYKMSTLVPGYARETRAVHAHQTTRGVKTVAQTAGDRVDSPSYLDRATCPPSTSLAERCVPLGFSSPSSWPRRLRLPSVQNRSSSRPM